MNFDQATDSNEEIICRNIMPAENDKEEKKNEDEKFISRSKIVVELNSPSEETGIDERGMGRN